MINIPERLEELLKNSEFSGPVNTFVSIVTKILDDNKLPFFPGYTDHGRQHVESVLKTEVELIPDIVWEKKLLHPVDAAIIICATLLHDLPMHLQEKGFLSLKDSKSVFKPLNWFDQSHGSLPADKPWHLLWYDYFVEASRWSDHMLNNIFGPLDEDSQDVWKVRELPKNSGNWTKYDRLLIGEFIRRHHGRLAHEMTLHGFPGLESSDQEKPFPLLSETMPQIADLIGLVARSHSLHLRSCIKYLDYQYQGDLRPRGSLVVYNMALLRVADYLQLNADRAPFILLRLRDPQSPLSVDEWNKHGAVAHISYEHTDPQAIKIDLGITHSLRTHHQMGQLLNGLQQEMDISSAVIREVYGHASKYNLDILGLRKTNVRSNIDDPSLIKDLPYFSVGGKFSADPHLLTLLVEPLYGKNPEIGIRELLQNAVDAVRERVQYCKKYNIEQTSLDFSGQDCDVLIEFREREDGTWILKVSDKGIGMQEKTIRHYFLRAGASFRKSSAWMEHFSDSKNRSKVIRSGRFGIGVFAAFLLSDQIEVTTRHIDDDRGFCFQVNENAELIELKYTNVPVGTTLEMMLEKETADRLDLFASDSPLLHESQPQDTDAQRVPSHWDWYYESQPRNTDSQRVPSRWDWYTLDEPNVKWQVISQDGVKNELKQNHQQPSFDQKTLKPGWRTIKTGSYPVINWSYNQDDNPKLVCNGIIVKSNNETGSDDIFSEIDLNEIPAYDYLKMLFHTPPVSLFDPEGNLPLTLKRDGLTVPSFPFEEILIEDVATDFIAYCLVCAPIKPFWNSDKMNRGF
jgi:hypothetical protein